MYRFPQLVALIAVMDLKEGGNFRLEHFTGTANIIAEQLSTITDADQIRNHGLWLSFALPAPYQFTARFDIAPLFFELLSDAGNL